MIEGLDCYNVVPTCESMNRLLGITSWQQHTIRFDQGTKQLNFMRHEITSIVLVSLDPGDELVEFAADTVMWVPGNPDLVANASKDDLKVLQNKIKEMEIPGCPNIVFTKK